MLLSFVLRLVPEALADGRFAGTVQVVATGRTLPFASLEELLVVLVPRPRDAPDRLGGARVVDLDAERGQASPAGPSPRTGA